MQTDAAMWKLVLAYDGTDFHGWQVQPDRLTVQGLLRDALARITGEDVLPQGSGRTDAGVHALGQVASFALAAPIPEANLARALNRILPVAIRVLSATRVAGDFHARHSALAKTYEYKIFRGEICPPWQARYVYALNTRLNGFLHHMVRNLVGTFLEVGRGNLAETEIPAILASRSRERAGPTAPARGLFLINVDYLNH
jgi:tRNA U38,U39,U40 pseudouridine synthase TruA